MRLTLSTSGARILEQPLVEREGAHPNNLNPNRVRVSGIDHIVQLFGDSGGGDPQQYMALLLHPGITHGATRWVIGNVPPIRGQRGDVQDARRQRRWNVDLVYSQIGGSQILVGVDEQLEDGERKRA